MIAALPIWMLWGLTHPQASTTNDNSGYPGSSYSTEPDPSVNFITLWLITALGIGLTTTIIAYIAIYLVVVLKRAKKRRQNIAIATENLAEVQARPVREMSLKERLLHKHSDDAVFHSKNVYDAEQSLKEAQSRAWLFDIPQSRWNYLIPVVFGLLPAIVVSAVVTILFR
jgi:hypothetical protein